MSEPTETTVPRFERMEDWQAGVAAGLAAGVGMGLLMTLEMSAVIEGAIPALWLLDGGMAGWLVHMVNSAVFGVVFAALVTRWPAAVRSLSGGVIVGGLYGIVLWLVAAGLVMPVWLDLVGFASPPAIPNLAPMSLAAHLLYGVVLGVVYPLIVTRETEF